MGALTLHRLVKESEANEMLFDFVWGSVEALDAAEEGVANFHLWFLSHLCRFLGFSPGNEYVPDAWFNIAEGCFTPIEPPQEYRMTQENALILRDMLECDVRYLGEIGLNRMQRVDFLTSNGIERSTIPLCTSPKRCICILGDSNPSYSTANIG